jgi:hypothetical protein
MPFATIASSCPDLRLFNYRMYDRTVKPIPEPPTTKGLKYRVETLIGITGVKMAKYRVSLWDAFWTPFKLVWRPHMLSILIFEVGHHGVIMAS